MSIWKKCRPPRSLRERPYELQTIFLKCFSTNYSKHYLDKNLTFTLQKKTLGLNISRMDELKLSLQHTASEARNEVTKAQILFLLFIILVYNIFVVCVLCCKMFMCCCFFTKRNTNHNRQTLDMIREKSRFCYEYKI